MRRIVKTLPDLQGVAGVGAVTAGMWGLFGWAAAALVFGGFLLAAAALGDRP